MDPISWMMLILKMGLLIVGLILVADGISTIQNEGLYFNEMPRPYIRTAIGIIMLAVFVCMI